MTANLIPRATPRTVALVPVEPDRLDAWRRSLAKAEREWLATTRFDAEPGQIGLMPDGAGGLAWVAVGIDPGEPLWSYGGLARQLPAGSYRIEADLDASRATAAATGWALGTYGFTRYRKCRPAGARLVWPRRADRAAVERAVAATFLVRDLINTPAGDMGPPELAAAARRLARRHRAECRVVVGNDLLKRNYPAVHAVGRAAAKAPRLIDLRWGRRGAPKLSLVGKGVCFDTGGLDLKHAGGMKLMKKDMGGAAHALGLAEMIMAAGLDVRLRVLIPAVENSIGGNAVHPMDVVRSRSGRTIEIGHTDAEGRVVLADALTEACREAPDLIVDFATLTGAARVALGSEVAVMFSTEDAVAESVLAQSRQAGDPVWRLPLWRPYADYNKSDVADISNEPSSTMGSAIAAALFLESFVDGKAPWVHFDIMAWNLRDRPGRPKGGEAMGLRAMYGAIAARYRRRAAKTARRRP
jgi:leucyl aminopeptidase